MKSDSFFKIGFSHDVCEDYAKHTDKAVALSDGCSTAADTDIGARLLVNNVLGSILFKYINWGENPSYYTNYIHHIVKALNSFCEDELKSKECLYATLMYIAYDEANFYVLSIGDGLILTRNRDTKFVRIADIEYPSGAPLYPAYFIKDRMGQYLESFKEIQAKVTIHEEHEDYLYREEYPVVLNIFPRLIYDMVAVSSDGLKSFYSIDKTSTSKRSVPYSVRTVINRIFDFKTMGGRFLHRRCKRLFKELEKEEIRHYDDFSIALLMDDKR